MSHALMAVSVAVTVMACGGVYEELAPAQKRRVSVVLFPDFVRIGDDIKQIGAYLEVPDEGTFVTSIDMGQGIEVVAFDTRGAGGCLPPQELPPLEDSEPFVICISVALLDDALVGEHTISIEVRVGSEPVIAEAPFFVLRQLDGR